MYLRMKYIRSLKSWLKHFIRKSHLVITNTILHIKVGVFSNSLKNSCNINFVKNAFFKEVIFFCENATFSLLLYWGHLWNFMKESVLTVLRYMKADIIYWKIHSFIFLYLDFILGKNTVRRSEKVVTIISLVNTDSFPNCVSSDSLLSLTPHSHNTWEGWRESREEHKNQLSWTLD